MRVTVDAMVRIDKPTPELRQWCERYLVVKNPLYAKKVRMGLYAGNTPDKIYLLIKDGDSLIVPYGVLDVVLDLQTGRDEFKVKIPKPVPVKYNCDIPLYNYQLDAVSAMLELQYGILQAPAGSGKTQMGLAIAAALGERTLWLTHTKDLLQQSMTRAQMYMSPDIIGTITEGKINIGKAITFGTIQTVSAIDLAQYKYTWDCIIVDECHRVAGTPTNITMFSKVLNSLGARHKYGLSATVHRADGLIFCTYAMLGRVAYTVDPEDAAEKIVKPMVIPRFTGIPVDKRMLSTDGLIHFSKSLTYMADLESRNRMIVNDIIANKDHYCIVLSDRKKQLDNLMAMLPPDMQALSVKLVGGLYDDDRPRREKVINSVREGVNRYVFATYPIAKEGLDIPRLDRLFMATPQADSAAVTQSIGRIGRTFEGKDTPIVYDYVDEKIRTFVRMYKKRKGIYKRIGVEYVSEDDKEKL